MTSFTQSWYTEPRSRTGSRERLTQDDIDQLGDDAVIYSQRGEAPEGFYNAGMTEGGAGYGDHQVFKKLPKAEAPANKNEPVKEKKGRKDKNQTTSKAQAAVPPSKEVTEAKQRSSAYSQELLNGDGYGAYGPKKSAFAERSSEIYNPNEGFQANQQTTVTADGDQRAQSFMQGRLNRTKNQFNFQPTLS